MTTQELANPYFELLGIPESELPANRYRLLGIPLFTANENVIRNGADRQMQFLRRVGGNKYLDDVQAILNEVAEAKIFLLNDEKRTPYDEQLREGSTLSGLSAFSPSLDVSFVILDGDRIGQTQRFEQDHIRIGSGPESELMLPDVQHEFLIKRHQDQWILESPTNRFSLNQRFVKDRAVLKSGDVIRFGIDCESVQFQIGDSQKQVNYWLEKFPHCRVDPLPHILPAPKWKRKPEPVQPRVSHQNSSKGFVKKTDTGFSFATIVFCVIAGCTIGAVLFYLFMKMS